jgi:dihydropyrimidine dehydrogenase (NAD+) subunit PreT
VDFLWQTAPVELHFTGSTPGSTPASTPASTLATLTCVRVDEALHPIPGSAFDLPCDLVILAIGQSPLLTLLSAIPGIDLRHGLVAADRATGRTANPTYYAGGDCVNGGREVVDAVADGKRAAIAIAHDLQTDPEPTDPEAAHVEVPSPGPLATRALHG